MDRSLPASSVHEISQARILEWAAISFSRGIFLTQRLNPCLLHLLHWQMDSLLLSHQGRNFKMRYLNLLPKYNLHLQESIRATLKAKHNNNLALCQWRDFKIKPLQTEYTFLPMIIFTTIKLLGVLKSYFLHFPLFLLPYSVWFIFNYSYVGHRKGKNVSIRLFVLCQCRNPSWTSVLVWVSAC